uniref:(northern house mosquito) hypothetical protein n=1 Tax=Culex pipiens TaxID=7175 RepID=A0A8D8KWD2_CULPI
MLCNQNGLQRIAQQFMMNSVPTAQSLPPPSDAEMVDLLRIFCEVKHEFWSDLLPHPREFVHASLHQHVSNIIQHKAGAHDMKNELENETMSKCIGEIYPI